MNKQQLIHLLDQIPDNLEVRIQNACIIDDEFCPTFEVTSIGKLSDAENLSDSEKEMMIKDEEDCVIIEFSNENYLADCYNIGKGCNCIYPTEGTEMIAKERFEQLKKHKFTIEHDQKKLKQGDLMRLADYIIFANEDRLPKNFDPTFIKQIFMKSREEQLAVAGACIAAEIDYRLYKISQTTGV